MNSEQRKFNHIIKRRRIRELHLRYGNSKPHIEIPKLSFIIQLSWFRRFMNFIKSLWNTQEIVHKQTEH